MVARPRKTAKRDYSHQIKKNKNVYVLYFFDCLYEKDYGVILLALFFEMILHFFNCLYEKDYAVIFLVLVFSFATTK